MPQHLFVYGTLAPGKPNEHVLKGIEGSWQPASVKGTLHSEGWGAALGYPAILLEESGDEVGGLLFSSERLPELWKQLDDFEGEPYERVRTKARLRDGKEVEAYVYSLKRTSARAPRSPCALPPPPDDSPPPPGTTRR